MIYLIGGAPRCGKTILSEALGATRKLSWISTDTFRSVILPYIPKSQVKKKLPDEFLRLEDSAPENLLKSELVESKTVWPGVHGMIEHLIACKQDYIIEGVHLMPELVQELKRKRYWKQIRVVFLVKTDLDEIKDGFGRNTSKHDWLSSALKNKPLIEKAARMVQLKSLYIAKQANKYRFSVIDTGKEFEIKIAEIASSLSRKI